MQNSKQHTLWLLAAMAAPLAHFSGCGWAAALTVSLSVLPLALIPKSWDDLSKPMVVVQLLWLGAVTGTLLQNSAAYWPSDSGVAVPLTLLALAALTGSTAGPRVGAVLAFCMALLAIPVAVTGIRALEPDWLRPTFVPWPWMLTLVLLMPNLPAGEGKEKGLVRVGALSASLALLTQATISPQVASNLSDPFWQAARTLGDLEPVIAVGITFGWYAMVVWLLESGRRIAKNSVIGARRSSVLVAGTAAAQILFKWQLQHPIMTLFSSFLWVLIPLLTKIKKVEKT